MTPADFKAAFPTPAFAALSDPVIQAEIDAATPYFDVTRWDAFYNRGLGLFVAHELTLAGLDPTYGAGSSSSVRKKVGEVESTRSTSFDPKSAGDPYQLTHYGKRFKELRSIVGAGAVTV